MTHQLRMLGVLALCASSAMLAQPPVASPAEAVEQATVSQLLASTDPGRQAWGAMLAGNYGHKKFIPDLRRLLTSPDHEIKLQAVDSLIRLRAPVPSEEVLALWPTHRDPALILLARSPKENQDVLLRLSREKLEDMEWVAVHNLLDATKTPGVAATLLSDFRVRLEVLVSDTGGAGATGAYGYAPICSTGAPRFRPGYPPLIVYYLTDSPALDDVLDDVLVAPGRHPIFYKRESPGCICRGNVDRSQYKHEYLAQLLSLPEKHLSLQPNMRRNILWTGPEAYLAEIALIQEETQQGFASTGEALINAGLATRHEITGMSAQLDLLVLDVRQDQRTPLPARRQ